MSAEFRDKGQTLETFSAAFLVRCPQCASCASVILNKAAETKRHFYIGNGNPNWFAPRRLVCARCGYNKDWAANTVFRNGAVDWYFRLPLWLQISCCGDILWAYNREHLDYLESFVEAELRESLPGSLASKLPVWIKSAKNRTEILRCIAKLKGT